MLGTVQWPSGTDKKLWPLGDSGAPVLHSRVA